MVITMNLSRDKMHHEVTIKLKLLDELRTNTDSILFIDLLKRMVEKIPDQRETCEHLIGHAALKSNQERLEIVQLLAEKCFDGDECINEYLIKVMDKNEVHMEGSLAEDSAEWKKLLAEVANFQTDIKKCSSLLKIFAVQVIFCSWTLASILNFIIVF